MKRVELGEWQVRAASARDVDALLELARLTGGGFTNLPPEREALAARVRWSDESLATVRDQPGDDMMMLVLEHRPTGRIAGTACLFSMVGQRHPFYSYRITGLSAHSRELGRTIRTEVLHLVNDYDGCSEVGGLFLHPDFRTGGLGRLLARSRYLFIARHRERFADKVLAELRGVISDDGQSPFWDGLAGRFFGMDFVEADRFNGVHGNQFIADLMPKYPVYVALLDEAAKSVMGREHPAGKKARELLEYEGFTFNGYIDIFDGGPTMECAVGLLRAVRDAEVGRIAPDSGGGQTRLLASGHLADFRCAALNADIGAAVRVPADSGFAPGEEVWHVVF